MTEQGPPISVDPPDDAAATLATDASRRRWSDRPGRTPARTFARMLATSPGLDEVARCLVGLLSWPVGATGAVIVREEDGVRRILARYEEPLDPHLEILRGRESEPCIADIVAAAGQLSPLIWTEPGHLGCRPMATSPLESRGSHVDHLVMILAEPESAATVSERMLGIPEVLAVYLAGRDPGIDSSVADSSGRAGTAAHLSERQARILEMMAHDLTMQQIASHIGYSDSTVRMESLAIYRALGVHDRHHAIEAAREFGLLPRDADGGHR